MTLRRTTLAGLLLVFAACGAPEQSETAAQVDAKPDPIVTPPPVQAPKAAQTLPPQRPVAARPAATIGQTDPVDMLDFSPRATYPGNYTYAVQGSYTGIAGSGQLGERTTFGVYSPRKNGTQRTIGWNDMGRMFDLTFRLQDDGRYLTSLKVSDRGWSAEFNAPGTVLLLPAEPSPGRSWSLDLASTDGKKTLKGSYGVIRTEAVSVAGQTVQAAVVEVSLTLTDSSIAPAQVMTMQGLEKWRPAYPLLLEARYTTELKAGPASTYRAEATRKLTSLRSG